MPPGWDGIETIARLWQVDPDLQTVICTAFADYSWDEMIGKLGQSDRLLILKKPFDPIEVQQLASALVEKWNAVRRERERMEETRAAELEARAYAASLKTINRALEASKASSEAAATAQSALLCNLSDKLAGPMRALHERLGQLCSPALSDDARVEAARALRGSTASLCAVFDNLSDYSRIESGGLEVERAGCSPIAIAHAVVRHLGARASEKGIQLAFETETPVPETFETDGPRLRQALDNVVDNAIRFTETGSVRVVLGVERHPRYGTPELALHVIDTGIGISAEEQGRLFEPFQPSSGPAAQYDGTRLGLTLSKRLCQLLGGDLEVESTPGAGSRFTLRVPLGDVGGVRMVDHPRAPLPAEAGEGEGVRDVRRAVREE